MSCRQASLLLLMASVLAACRAPEPKVPLVAAAASGNAARVTALLDAGTDPNTVDVSIGSTALVAAARAGHTDLIALLVRRGADPDRPTGRNMWTPLMHAIHKGRADSVRALLVAGADPNRGIGWGFTPLMMASGNGSLTIVGTLLEAGADPRVRRADGTTALTLAVSGGALTDIERPLLGACHTDVVKALLRRAPDLRQDHPRGLDLSRLFARLNGCDEVLRLTADP